MIGAAVQVSTPCKMEHSLTGELCNESESFYSVQNGTQYYRRAMQWFWRFLLRAKWNTVLQASYAMILKVSTPCKMEHSLTGELCNESDSFYSVQNGIQSYRRVMQWFWRFLLRAKWNTVLQASYAMSLKVSTPCKMEHSLVGWLNYNSEGFYSVQNGTQSRKLAKL